MYLIFKCYDDFSSGGIIPLFISEDEEFIHNWITEKENEEWAKLTKDPTFNQGKHKWTKEDYFEDEYKGWGYQDIEIKKGA